MANKIITKHGYVKNISNASLAEGELAVGFDDTKTAAELYVGSAASKVKINLKGEQGERGANATLVVAASNSSLKSQAAADYTCSGSGDQSTIRSAIDALPAGGGKVLLLEGTYNINSCLDVYKSNVMLEGMGDGTVLKRAFDNNPVIWLFNNNINVSNFCIEGNDSYDLNYGIYTSPSDNLKNIIIHNVSIIGEKRGIVGTFNDSKIYSCFIDGQAGMISGIWLKPQSSHNIIFSNTCCNMAAEGIMCDNITWNIITNNKIYSVGYGIRLVNGGYNIIHSNEINENILTSISTETGSVSNLVVGNLYEKDYVNSGGATNQFESNLKV